MDHWNGYVLFVLIIRRYLLADTQVDHGHDEDDGKEDQSSGTRKTVVAGLGQVVLNMSYDGIHIRATRDRL